MVWACAGGRRSISLERDAGGKGARARTPLAASFTAAVLSLHRPAQVLQALRNRCDSASSPSPKMTLDSAVTDSTLRAHKSLKLL